MMERMMQPTVAEYLYDCLNKEGITEIFGVPGDYNFSLLDTLERNGKINFINCRNELNAGYAADAYSRLKGFGALITTFGVGELSVCNAIAGSYSEFVPVVHIVGAPKTMFQNEHKKMHHTLMDGDFDAFRKVYENLTAYSTVVTAENAQIEIPRALQIAKELKKPVYLLIAIDVAEQPVMKREFSQPQQKTDKNALQTAAKHMEELVKNSQRPVLLCDVHAVRYGLQPRVQQLADKMNMPAVVTMMGKGSFDESHKNFIGLYAGKWGSAQVQNIVEASDCLIAVGPVWSDYTTGAFTAQLNPSNIIEIQPSRIKVGVAVYENILIQDSVNELLNIAAGKSLDIPNINFPYNNVNADLNEHISSKYYYPRFQQFIKENDIVIADVGTLMYGLAQLRLPKGTTYITQGAWGSIGYATPAALGACIADKSRRVILFAGDGSLQMTAQELSTMLQNQCKPLIFLLNNKFYTIEAYINKPKKTHYNDIPEWDYAKLLDAFGGNAFTAKVYTNRELDNAIRQAEEQCKEKLCLIEIFADPMDAPEMLHKVRQVMESSTN